jgi:hypothetical protein
MNFPRVHNNPLSEQILDAFPSGSYAMAGLMRLLDIIETEAVPTAAVDCTVQPRMRINPRFVQEHAATPEKLLMLVMHELHHVLLGHTTLFPRVTRLQNFVFDAVINGILCRMFPSAEHTSFFNDLYSAKRFPECILRPPPGWPHSEKQTAPALLSLPESLQGQVQELHAALYSPAGASYYEVYAVLPKVLLAVGVGSADLKNCGDVLLLGEHGDGVIPDGQLEKQSPLLFDIVRELVEQWPQPPDPIRGRSLSDFLRPRKIRPKRALSNRGILRRLIRKVASATEVGRARRVGDDRMGVLTPIPNISRRSIVLRALGTDTMLYPVTIPWRHRISVGEKVHVYIDVSGSMEIVLKALYGAVLDCQEFVHRPIHLFSTKVVDISLSQLEAGQCHSTGGTDINCVAEHMALNHVTRAVLITDGWVGKARGQCYDTLAKSRLAVAYLGNSFNQTDLGPVANHTSILNTGD